MRFISCLVVLIYTISISAGPHTVQRGESWEDIARLYDVSVDSIINANPGIEPFVGVTIEIPLSILVYDLGDCDLFRAMRYSRTAESGKKGFDKYRHAVAKHIKYCRSSDEKAKKTEAKVVNEYYEAVMLGSTDALYELGRMKVHGSLQNFGSSPSFTKKVNSNVEEFRKGLEYLQVAVLIGNKKNALIELALACGYENSPIRNPYLCLAMLEQYQSQYDLDVNDLICYMYENGYGIRQDLLQAYVYCPSKELTDKNGKSTHREKILKKIEAMPQNFESARYGVGLDTQKMLTLGFAHYHNDVLDPEGIFWLHRAARLNDADANWVLASIIKNENCAKGAVGRSWYSESQILSFVQKAADNGKEEAKQYLADYQKQLEAKAEQQRRIRLEQQRLEEEKKQRRLQMWANIANAVVQTTAQTFVAMEQSKMQRHQSQMVVANPTIGQMSEAQWMAKNQLALQQIAQYTVNKYQSDYYGTPMIPTDMSAVDLGTDMSPGSPLWCWGMQQQINTIDTQNARSRFERWAYHKRQSDMMLEQLNNQLLQPNFQPVFPTGQELWNSGNFVMPSGGFDAGSTMDFSTNGGINDNGAGTPQSGNTYYKERYGDKDCPFCHRSGKCPTCNGRGYDQNSMTSGTHECPNCLLVNGRRSGKCSQCQGKGTVFGLK